MLGDGLVPSNAKAGYLARMLARRILRMRDDLGMDVSLSDLINHHLDVNMSGHEMKQTRDGLLTIMNLEEERYSEVLRKGTNLIQQSLKSVDQSAEELPDELLFQLYDSHGIPPDMVINMAKSGWSHLRLEQVSLRRWLNDMQRWQRLQPQQVNNPRLSINYGPTRNGPTVLQRCSTT